MSDDQTPVDPNLDDSKASRRHRFKDALSRTKTKLEKLDKKRHDFQEARLEKREKDDDRPNPKYNVDDDVNDFLSAGKSNSTSRPSEDSSLLYDTSPRPSTADSDGQYPKPPQQSPRRIDVPRIDVSSSQRYPNAKLVEEGNKSSSTARTGSASNSLLQPEYKARSLSSTTISAARKARIRGLSVGFSDSPPVVIGEGGDEAETPPVEISRAKARARSASPLGRRAYDHIPSAGPQQRGPTLPGRPSDGLSDAQPQQAGRFRSPSLEQNSRQPAPPPPLQAAVSPSAYQPPTAPFHGPARTNTNDQDDPSYIPKRLGRTQTGIAAMNQEFDMTLGMPSTPTSQNLPPMPTRPKEPQLVAPKPQRPPPSYTLIENGPIEDSKPQSKSQDDSDDEESSARQQIRQQAPKLPRLSFDENQSPVEERRPAPQQRPGPEKPSSPPVPKPTYQQQSPEQRSPPRSQQPEQRPVPPPSHPASQQHYYPPPPLPNQRRSPQPPGPPRQLSLQNERTGQGSPLPTSAPPQGILRSKAQMLPGQGAMEAYSPQTYQQAPPEFPLQRQPPPQDMPRQNSLDNQIPPPQRQATLADTYPPQKQRSIPSPEAPHQRVYPPQARSDGGFLPQIPPARMASQETGIVAQNGPAPQSLHHSQSSPPALRHKRGDVQQVAPMKDLKSDTPIAERVPLHTDLELNQVLNASAGSNGSTSAKGMRFYGRVNTGDAKNFM